MVLFKLISNETIFKVGIKFPILPNGTTLMSLLQYLGMLLCTLLEELETGVREELYKNGVIKIFTKFTGKPLHLSLFCNKAEDWRPPT